MKMIEISLGERWRKLLREVSIITLGVLIALAIGEAAESLRWRLRLNAAERMIDAELQQSAAIYHERILVTPCLRRRVEQIAAILARARTTGVLPQISAIGRSGRRPS